MAVQQHDISELSGQCSIAKTLARRDKGVHHQERLLQAKVEHLLQLRRLSTAHTMGTTIPCPSPTSFEEICKHMHRTLLTSASHRALQHCWV